MATFYKCLSARCEKELGLKYRASLRLLKRKSSHYLSEKWLKEPFDIGYPICSDEILKDRAKVREILFNEKQRDQSQEQNFLYVHPKPKYESGFQLFRSQLRLGLKSRTFWESLTSPEKEIFKSPSILQHVFKESQRIWEGYEIVEYLKRYLLRYLMNPYLLLNLYPWEIIKDKLRRKSPPYDFEKDYYDALIKEAFGRNSQRTALSIFYTDLRTEFPEKKYTLSRVQELMLLLPPERKKYYQQKEEKRHSHAQEVRQRPRKSRNNFLEFVKGFLRDHYSNNLPYLPGEQLRAAASRWNELSLEERLSFKNKSSIPPNSRLYKENMLDWKVDIVMDYIFQVGGVVGSSMFDWKNDKLEKTNGYRYIKKGYVYALPYLVDGKLKLAR